MKQAYTLTTYSLLVYSVLGVASSAHACPFYGSAWCSPRRSYCTYAYPSYCYYPCRISCQSRSCTVTEPTMSPSPSCDTPPITSLPSPDPKELPQITDVPSEPPELVIPNALKELQSSYTDAQIQRSSDSYSRPRLFDIRQWTHRDGRTSNARLVSFGEHTVQLEKLDRVYSVPLEVLSEADQSLIRSERRLNSVSAR